METVFATIVVILLFVGASFLVWGFFSFLKAISSPLGGGGASASSDLIDGMDEGDYHNGPGGYNAISSYPDSYYGRGADDDDEHA